MTDTIRNTIDRFANGYVFTADDFLVRADKQNTVTNVLNNYGSGRTNPQY
jgi:hypothetical protein